MTVDTPIFTTKELAVLTGILGGCVFYGSGSGGPIGKRDVLTTTNELLRRSVLTMDDREYRIADRAVRDMLAPLCRPRAVVYLTPRTAEQPQVCYLLDDSRGLGIETVLVQADAVRVFGIDRNAWADDVLRRCAQSDPFGEPFAAREDRTADRKLSFDMDINELLEKCPCMAAALEYITPPGEKATCKVLCANAPGGMSAIVLSEGKCEVTDKLPCAIGC